MAVVGLETKQNHIPKNSLFHSPLFHKVTSYTHTHTHIHKGQRDEETECVCVCVCVHTYVHGGIGLEDKREEGPNTHPLPSQ